MLPKTKICFRVKSSFIYVTQIHRPQCTRGQTATFFVLRESIWEKINYQLTKDPGSLPQDRLVVAAVCREHTTNTQIRMLICGFLTPIIARSQGIYPLTDLPNLLYIPGFILPMKIGRDHNKRNEVQGYLFYALWPYSWGHQGFFQDILSTIRNVCFWSDLFVASYYSEIHEYIKWFLPHHKSQGMFNILWAWILLNTNPAIGC